MSYTAAKALKAKLEHEGVVKVKAKGDDMTVSEFLYEFVEKYGAKRWVASTYDGNVGLLENYVHPYLGDKKLKSIRTKTVDDYYDFLLEEAEPAANMGRQKREHVTASTVHDIHKIVRCAFNLAVKWDYISTNPFIKATLPEHKEKERKVLEPEQVLKVLDFTCRKEYYDYYLMHCAIHLAIACTMRGGEIGALQWDRVDMVKQRVSTEITLSPMTDSMSRRRWMTSSAEAVWKTLHHPPILMCRPKRPKLPSRRSCKAILSC